MTERDTGPDPLGDLQRWLMRTGARSVTKEMTGSVRRALGQDRPAADVWDTATNRPEDEAPECAWCPVCRAARRMRERQAAPAWDRPSPARATPWRRWSRRPTRRLSRP